MKAHGGKEHYVVESGELLDRARFASYRATASHLDAGLTVVAG